MGQYYEVLLETNEVVNTTKGGSVNCPERRVINNPSGLKLMEHSYFDNDYVGMILKEILDKPTKVAWVGDYADDYISDGKTAFFNENLSDEDILKLHKLVWSQTGTSLPEKEDADGEWEIQDYDYFIINETKKQFIDAKAYYETHKELWNPDDDNSEFCIHPLPLLTSVGSGYGGGDYHKGCADYDFCGHWCFDVIKVSRTKPDETYSDVTDEFNFKE